MDSDTIEPNDLEFRVVHGELRDARFSPHFHDFLGPVDVLHILVIVLADEICKHVIRH